MADREAGFDLDALRAIVAADEGSPDFPALAEAERRSGDPERARKVAAAGLVAAPGRLAGRVALGLALVDLGRLDEARATLSVILDATLAPHRLAAQAVASNGSVDHSQTTNQTGERDLLSWPSDRDPASGMPAWAGGSADVAGTRFSAELASFDVGADPRAGIDDDELEMAFAVAEPQIDEMISPNRMAERVLLDQDTLEDPLDETFGFSSDDDDESAPLELDEEEDGIAAPGPAFRTATMAELLAKQGDAAGAEAIRRELGRRTDPVRPVDAAVVPVASPAGWDRDDRSAIATAIRSGQERNDRSPGRSSYILATLERWLQNIQRGRA
jgi:hypothetical protein